MDGDMEGDVLTPYWQDSNADYCAMASERLRQGVLL